MHKNTGQNLFAVFALAFLFLFAAPLAPAAQEELDFGTIELISVVGNTRIEANTIATYLTVNVGDSFDPQAIDASLKTLFATGLFADVVMERSGNTLVIRVIENPIINRIVFEGNSRLKEDDFAEEVELRPRMIYTRAKVRSDVQRILELYRRSGRFAAVVEPKVIQREQNRVDLVFEISEGPRSRVSRINFIGNRVFSDKKLRGVIATNEARWWKFFTSNDTYDPDRLQFDREEIRQHYLDNGYADIRIVSAVAELTPDQRDFFITFVVDEGEKYSFGVISVESDIKALPHRLIQNMVAVEEGQTYSATKVENTVENITNIAGILGFAFLDIRPEVERDRQNRTISINFRVFEVPRTYIERIDIHGNVRTLDRVIRREFRLAEGDAFNSLRVQRSEQRLQLLGFFREVNIEQLPGSQDDLVVLDVTVEEQATGEFSLGFGYSSFDGFIFDTSISERNFLGKGQQITLGFLLSGRRKNINIAFTQPYFLNRNLVAGINVFRQDFSNREAGFETKSTGITLNLRFPISEFITLGTRYTIRQDKIKVPEQFLVSPFLAESIGNNTTSSIGYSISYINLDDFRFPTDGEQIIFSQDFAGLGGNIRYLRSSLEADLYRPIIGGWVAHAGLEAGYIKGLGQRVRINDRFFLGNPRFRGFDVAGVGPIDTITRQFLGGNIFYVATIGVLVPLGDFAEELGFQLSAYIDAGTLYNAELPIFDQNGDLIPVFFNDPLTSMECVPGGVTTCVPFVTDSSALRVAVGIGLIWDSPFGPVRLDVARVIIKQPFDRTQTIQFNIGTRF
ncbi:MAG: outer membrane protein assembly factor BamA [Proteobacteria bacterium]|nr:outer membrane protein assembly factor BamA [Pseudomonadota bacterium]